MLPATSILGVTDARSRGVLPWRYFCLRRLWCEAWARSWTSQSMSVSQVSLQMLRISRAMFLKMLESYPDAAQRLREMIASRAEQWAREMENVRAALARGAGPQ